MANYYVRDTVAVIEADNQPVNALSLHLREAIDAGLYRANSDPKVKSIVLCGKGRTFPAGADITEFGGSVLKSGPAVASITDLCNSLENSRKPTIAAVHGTVLGGGCELAISCHYRVSHNGTQFGFPEVTLGILPAANGTQRFPRLCGAEAAFKYIPTGDRISVKEAQKIGMIHKVVNNNLLDEAIQFAKNVCDKPTDNLQVSRMPVRDAAKARELAEAALNRAAQKSKGILAPVFNIKSVIAAVELPWEQGVEKEAEYAALLFTSGQAKAQQYAFFAQRAATKWSLPGVDTSSVRPLPIKSAAVIGAGTMGTGIAMALLNSGIPVTLLEQNEKFLAGGVKALQTLYSGSVKLGKMSEAQMKAVLSRLTPTVNYSDLNHVDLVIEAVYENMSVKEEVFKKLDSVCKPSAILCSNTSFLDIDQMASATKRPDKVVGTHFFVPAYYMKLLENVRGKHTSAQTIATVTELGKRIGKVPVLVGNCFGFVGNRMQSKYTAESIFLLEEGATPSEVDDTVEGFGMALGRLKTNDLSEEGALPWEVDQTMEDAGMTLGSFKVEDLSGLDIGWRVKQEVAKAQGRKPEKKRFINGQRASYLTDIMCENGRFGRKAGKGWYRYEKPGAKQAFPDPWVEETIIKYSQENGIVRRKISTQEIEERCFFSMINEGFKILEEGIASKPEEIDTVWLLGYGWPKQTGGPMFYANTVGIPKIYQKICKYYDQNPQVPHWQPSELLRRVAENNTPMALWTSHINHSKL